MKKKQDNNKINLLGVNISNLTKNEILKKIGSFLTDGKQHQIVTPNPEFLLEARRDEEFFYILNKADLAIPDGIGLKFAGWCMGKNIHRITGADLAGDILRIAEEKKFKAAIVNWSGGLSKARDIKIALKEKYPDLKFLVFDIGGNLEQGIGNLADFQPDILFATLGAPRQEKFIYHNLSKLPSVKIGMGAGGAFDFLTGRIKRAPKAVRTIGLEWLWRLSTLFIKYWFQADETEYFMRRRMKRIYNAVIIFPWQFFKWRFILPFLYRPNVSCILFKKEGDKIKILLVERKDEPGHWQLPQGGTDGEDLATAGLRELTEELGTDKFKQVAVFKNLWKYKFGNQSSQFGFPAQLVWGYKGQKQGLFIAKFIGNDNDIKINFWEHINWKWVDSENLINEVYDYRKEAVKIFLNKFNEIQI